MPAAVDRCVTRITPELKRQYPNKSDEEISQLAWATCTKLWNQGKLARNGGEKKLW